MPSDFTAGLFKLRFKALGTNCLVQFRAPEIEAARSYRTAALAWIKDFEATWSRFLPDSLLCRINAAAGKEAIALTPKQDEIIKLCAHTYEVSGGVLDPTSLPLTQLWDQGRIPAEKKVRQTLELVSWPEVQFQAGEIFLPHEGMALEIGGFGKEYAADQLIALAKHHGVTSALVDLGRDVATLGSPPESDYWIVGVENARELDAPVHRLALSGQALATSGNGRRFREIEGRKFGHIIDSRTGYPVENDILTASCLASDCLTAGLFSTTACVVGAEEGMSRIESRLHLEGLLQTSGITLYSHKIHHTLIS